MIMSKLLYFRQSRDEDTIMAALAQIAAGHGYINHAGPAAGAGNAAELMAAIATGEVATVLLPDEQRDMVIDWMRSQSPTSPPLAEALHSIAGALATARQRDR